MDFQNWIEYIDGMAGIYSFDILPDGSYSEIRLMALNRQNTVALTINPNAPEFYPGIPWRRYFTDINFESYIYKCAGTNDFLYSYANAHGFWLKGFYLPMNVPTEQNDSDLKTVYCLYVGTMSPEMESDSMSQHSAEVSSAVMNISIKLHQTQDFFRSMASAVEEIQKVCSAEHCALYTVDKNTQQCYLIDQNGIQKEFIEYFSREMNRTPYEVALAWEEDLDDSDCLLLNDLRIVEERDPVWYHSLCRNNVKNIILFAVRFNQALVGFIWAVNYDSRKMTLIKETLELTTFLIAAVISNHQLVSRLEVLSTIDGLTQVLNRNALNERVSEFLSDKTNSPASMGVVYADLNGLKTVNDLDGHSAGDKLLRTSASLLKIAFGDYEIYRVGGDEFVIFCQDIAEEELKKLVKQLHVLTETTQNVSFAVGTCWVSGEYDISSAMQTADEQMYLDKENYYRLHPEKIRRKNT